MAFDFDNGPGLLERVAKSVLNGAVRAKLGRPGAAECGVLEVLVDSLAAHAVAFRQLAGAVAMRFAGNTQAELRGNLPLR